MVRLNMAKVIQVRPPVDSCLDLDNIRHWVEFPAEKSARVEWGGVHKPFAQFLFIPPLLDFLFFSSSFFQIMKVEHPDVNLTHQALDMHGGLY